MTSKIEKKSLSVTWSDPAVCVQEDPVFDIILSIISKCEGGGDVYYIVTCYSTV